MTDGEHDDTNSNLDDGLPLEPEARRAAVAAQFDGLREELEALNAPAVAEKGAQHMDAPEHGTREHPAAAWYRRDLDRVERELLAVVQRYGPMVGSRLVAHALLETCGSVLVAMVEADPEAQGNVDRWVADLALFVSAGGRPQ